MEIAREVMTSAFGVFQPSRLAARDLAGRPMSAKRLMQPSPRTRDIRLDRDTSACLAHVLVASGSSGRTICRRVSSRPQESTQSVAHVKTFP